MDIKDFKQQILPLKDKLYRFALRIVGDQAVARDVVQEVMIKVWNDTDRRLLNPEAFCMTLTRNMAIDKLRSKHRRVVELDAVGEAGEPTPSPLATATTNDMIAYVRRLMAALPEKQRAVMHLRDIEGFAYEEIAQILQLSLQQVKVYLFRARKHIRQQLISTKEYEH